MICKVALLFLLLGQAPPTAEPGQPEKQATEVVQPAQTGEAEVQAEEAEEQPAVEQQQPPPKQKRPAWITWVILLGILVVFYLVMILPQRRRQKKHQEMLKSLNRGDRIVTNGGVIGTITRVKEESFIVKTADKTELEIDKSVVSQKK
ncbi:preprotein translocase subunit YajC [candidate division TA06 bacterium B3_TA06]|uniref:Preprotein translocase subunit YajC n=1 Tax=candidate division TA06 bacterium B3_TA06 TaxID=2012487 RepID=A0A532V9U3_UNCT6|nr:MAG: preprotein translocase subunit YajC [candidate division TA06 bacterium B3_TA06]